MEYKATFKRACFYPLCEEYYILRISAVENKIPPKPFCNYFALTPKRLAITDLAGCGR
jgi:hypothetical protein